MLGQLARPMFRFFANVTTNLVQGGHPTGLLSSSTGTGMASSSTADSTGITPPAPTPDSSGLSFSYWYILGPVLVLLAVCGPTLLAKMNRAGGEDTRSLLPRSAPENRC